MAASYAHLCYARADADTARSVAAALRHEGWRVSMDDAIGPGERIGDALRRSIRAADALVLVWTGRTRDSDWVMQELGAAWALQKRVVVVGEAPIDLDRLPFDVSAWPFVRLGDTAALGAALARRSDQAA